MGNYQPKNPDSFEGYVFSKLEDHTDRLDKIEIKVDKNTKAISHVTGIAAGLGAVFGIGAAFVRDIFTKGR